MIEQARSNLFGDVVVAVMYNFAKDTSGMFDVDESRRDLHEAPPIAPRRRHRREALPVSPCRPHVETGADFIVKGLRTPGDFEIEQQMAQMNHSVRRASAPCIVPCRPDAGIRQ